MAANNETKVQKSNTLEQWRVKTNTVSHHVGDIDLLDGRLTDGLFLFTGDGSTTRFGFGTDNSSKSLRIELQPENPVDSIAQILLTGSPSLTGFVADVVVFQGSVGSETFTGQINYINANKIVLRNTTGTFNPSADLKYASNTISNANIVKLISESYDTGYAKVKVDGNTQVQEVGIGSQAGYHILNYSLEVVLSGSPSIPAEFTEGAILTQSGGFVGTILEVSATHLRFKTHTGTFATNTLVQLQGDASKRILAANLSSVATKDTAIGTVIEFHTAPASGKSISINTQNIVDSITEVQDDVGNISNLGTGDKSDIVNAINELEAAARDTNSDYALGTNAQNFRDAINELETASRGTNANYTLGTNAQNFRDGINELETAVRGTHTNYTLGTNADNLIQAVNELEGAARGNNSNYHLGTTAQNFRDAINELEGAARGTNSSYTLTTSTQNFKEAINELDAEIGTISTFSGLASDVSAALVQLHTEIGDVSASNMGTTASNVTSAIFELEQEIDTLNTNHLNKNLAGNVNQNITGSITFTGDSVDFSNTTALFSSAGGVANFGSAFVNLNATAASGSNVALQGLQVDRTAISGGASTHDVRLIWNEGSVAGKPHKAWELRGMNNSGGDHTAEIVTFYNAYELVANNTESGINVTWDSGNNNFDFNVNDPTLTFTSPTFRSSGNLGQATITNLGNTTFALTANKLDLGYSEHIRLGGSDEFQIFNDNTESVISSTDVLNIRTNTFRLHNQANTETQIAADANGAVQLYHNGNSKLQTTSGGVVVTGEMEAGSLDINGNFDISGNGTIHGNTTVGGTLAVNGNVTLGNSTSDTVTIAGDLIVQGDETKLNVSTLEVEDILILTGSSTTTLPTTGGFGFETKLFSGRANQVINGRQWSAAGKHPNAAGNVTGSHSIVFNFGYDPGGGAPKGRWEMDGSPLLSAATVGSPQIEGQNFTTGDNLNFVAGTGMTLSTGKSGTTHTVTYTNDDRGSAQKFYRTFTADSGGSAVAATNEDTITISGGAGLASVRSGDTITINHDDTSSQGSVNNSGGTVIQDISVDTYGHTTSIGSVNLDIRYYQKSEFNSSGTAANSPVLRNGNRDIFARRFDSTESDSSGTAVFVGRASNIVNQANSATITAVTSGSANTIGLRDGSGQLTAARFLGPITTSGATGVLITHSDIRSAASSNWTGDPGGAGKIQYHSNRWYIVADQSSNRIVQFRRNNLDVSHIDNSGNYVGNVTGNVSGQAGTIANQQNSATINATSANVANNIVIRNTSGGFNAGTINANLSGNVTGNVTGSSGSCTGNAASASKVYVTGAQGNASYAVPYVDYTGNASGNRDLRIDSGGHFRYNPSSNRLDGISIMVATNYYGTWSGNAIPYSSLSGLPTIPSAPNNGTLTMSTSNGLSGSDTFTANQSTNTTFTVSLDSDLRGHVSLIGTSSSYMNTSDSSNIYWVTNSANRMRLSGTTLYVLGDVIASSSTASSDEKLKDNIQVVENALDKVCELNGVTFKWKDSGRDGAGVIAQNVEKVLPSAVHEVEGMEEGEDLSPTESHLGVEYNQLSALFIEAIKELKEENKLLRAEIENLKSINS